VRAWAGAPAGGHAPAAIAVGGVAARTDFDRVPTRTEVRAYAGAAPAPAGRPAVTIEGRVSSSSVGGGGHKGKKHRHVAKASKGLFTKALAV